MNRTDTRMKSTNAEKGQLNKQTDTSANIATSMRKALGLPDPPDAMPTKTEPLRGVYFHYIEDDKLERQGVILRHIGAEHVLILTFEWLIGQPSCQYLIKISDLVWNRAARTGYYLYDSYDLFIHSYNEGMAHSAECRGKEAMKEAREAKRKLDNKEEEALLYVADPKNKNIK
jgi:hypothetical protein